MQADKTQLFHKTFSYRDFRKVRLHLPAVGLGFALNLLPASEREQSKSLRQPKRIRGSTWRISAPLQGERHETLLGSSRQQERLVASGRH